MFFKNKKINRGAKKVDKIVTSIIIGSAIASIFGLSQTKKGKEITKEISSEIHDKITPNIDKTGKKAITIFGKIIAFFAGLFTKK